MIGAAVGMDLVSTGRGSVGTGTDVAVVTGAAWHAVRKKTKHAKEINRKDAKVLILFRAWASFVVIVIDQRFKFTPTLWFLAACW